MPDDELYPDDFREVKETLVMQDSFDIISTC